MSLGRPRGSARGRGVGEGSAATPGERVVARQEDHLGSDREGSAKLLGQPARQRYEGVRAALAELEHVAEGREPVAVAARRGVLEDIAARERPRRRSDITAVRIARSSHRPSDSRCRAARGAPAFSVPRAWPRRRGSSRSTGGIRGITPAIVLQAIEANRRVDRRSLQTSIAGTSTGG